MEATASSVLKTKKLSDLNCHFGKSKVELVLTFWEPIGHIDLNIKAPSAELSKVTWHKASGKEKAIIELYMADEHLKHVRYWHAAAEMWQVISELYRRCILLSHSIARRHFYTAKMKASKCALFFIYLDFDSLLETEIQYTYKPK